MKLNTYKIAVATIEQQYIEIKAENSSVAFNEARKIAKKRKSVDVNTITCCAIVNGKWELKSISVTYPYEMTENENNVRRMSDEWFEAARISHIKKLEAELFCINNCKKATYDVRHGDFYCTDSNAYTYHYHLIGKKCKACEFVNNANKE